MYSSGRHAVTIPEERDHFKDTGGRPAAIEVFNQLLANTIEEQSCLHRVCSILYLVPRSVVSFTSVSPVSGTLAYNHWSAGQCSTIQCNSVMCSSKVKCNATVCSAVQSCQLSKPTTGINHATEYSG